MYSFLNEDLHILCYGRLLLLLMFWFSFCSGTTRPVLPFVFFSSCNLSIYLLSINLLNTSGAEMMCSCTITNILRLFFFI